MKIALTYLIIINLLTFFTFAADKSRAKRGAWRIPERTLFLLAALGGSPGALAGMYLFRHKTRHRAFTFGIPALLLIQAAGVCFLWYRFLR